jgi:Fe-S cluster assembly ATP-binding protein
MLEVKNLHVDVGGKAILNGLDLTVEKGTVHAIMGPNGSGKSTLSYALAGKDGYEITEGEILFDGQDVTELEPDERATRGLFLYFQYAIDID